MTYIFLDKYGYRTKSHYNNLTKLKKIKNLNLFFISGRSLVIIEPILYLISKYKKNVLLIYTDDQFYHRILVNRIWWNNPSEVPDKLDKCNNLFLLDFLSIKYFKRIQPYPLFIEKSKPTKKIIYISEWKDNQGECIEKLWSTNKNNILKKFYDPSFNIYQNISDDKLFSIFTGLSNKVRGYYCKNLLKDFPNEFMLLGKDWGNISKSGKNFMNYNPESRRERYKGAICVDFLSKSGISVLYQRTLEIIESGGLLIQSYGYDSEQIYGQELCQKICFRSYLELRELIIFYLSDFNAFEDTLRLISSHFNNVENLLYDKFFAKMS